MYLLSMIDKRHNRIAHGSHDRRSDAVAAAQRALHANTTERGGDTAFIAAEVYRLVDTPNGGWRRIVVRALHA